VAISAVGTYVNANNATSGTTYTLAVSPTAIGHLLFLTVACDTATTTVSATSVSGGGVTTWTKVAGHAIFSASNVNLELWMGVITATGSQTITVTWSASATGHYLGAQEFSSSLASPVWGVDGGGQILNNASSTAVTYPTRVASATGELYAGFAFVAGTGSTSGATSGYTVQLDGLGNPFIYNPSVSGSQSPAAVQSPAGVSTSSGVLVTDVGNTIIMYPTTVASTTGSTWTNTANATGQTTSSSATFTNATSGGTGTIQLSGYAVQTVIGTQPTSINSVTLTLRDWVSSTSNWTAASCTAQLFTGTTAIGSAVAVGTLSTTVTTTHTIAFTGANVPTWAQCSDLQVTVTAKHAANTTSSTFNVDTAGLTVNYTPSAASAAQPAGPPDIYNRARIIRASLW
jgi:large repetitive protein